MLSLLCCFIEEIMRVMNSKETEHQACADEKVECKKPNDT